MGFDRKVRRFRLKTDENFNFNSKKPRCLRRDKQIRFGVPRNVETLAVSSSQRLHQRPRLDWKSLDVQKLSAAAAVAAQVFQCWRGPSIVAMWVQWHLQAIANRLTFRRTMDARPSLYEPVLHAERHRRVHGPIIAVCRIADQWSSHKKFKRRLWPSAASREVRASRCLFDIVWDEHCGLENRWDLHSNVGNIRSVSTWNVT